MNLWYNVNIVLALDFQITYYVQYQFHKVFPSLLKKAGKEVPGALFTQPLLFQLFNMLKMPLQEI